VVWLIVTTLDHPPPDTTVPPFNMRMLAMGAPSGRRNVTRLERGHSAAYLVAKLKRGAPICPRCPANWM
jgi:hypothetical protein